jgi:hypothetical protein
MANTAYLDYSVEIQCPVCHQFNNLADSDDDHIVSAAIFNNKWDTLEGHEVECSHCHHEFKIDSVEY